MIIDSLNNSERVYLFDISGTRQLIFDLKLVSTRFLIYAIFFIIRHIFVTYVALLLNNLFETTCIFYFRTRIICRYLSRALAAYDGNLSSRRRNFNFRVGEQRL